MNHEERAAKKIIAKLRTYPADKNAISTPHKGTEYIVHKEESEARGDFDAHDADMRERRARNSSTSGFGGYRGD